MWQFERASVRSWHQSHRLLHSCCPWRTGSASCHLRVVDIVVSMSKAESAWHRMHTSFRLIWHRAAVDAAATANDVAALTPPTPMESTRACINGMLCCDGGPCPPPSVAAHPLFVLSAASPGSLARILKARAAVSAKHQTNLHLVAGA